jgi:hypothetical protein
MTRTKLFQRGTAALCALAVIFIFSGCARIKPSVKNMDLIPGASEAAITIVRITDSGMGQRIGEPQELDIFLDGNKADTIGRNQRMQLIVPNGPHTVFVQAGSKAKSEEISFTANSDGHLFHIYWGGTINALILEKMN